MRHLTPKIQDYLLAILLGKVNRVALIVQYTFESVTSAVGEAISPVSFYYQKANICRYIVSAGLLQLYLSVSSVADWKNFILFRIMLLVFSSVSEKQIMLHCLH